MTHDSACNLSDPSKDIPDTVQIRNSPAGEPIHGTDSPLPCPGVPALVGDYELLGEIARGGMGIVYKALQRKLNRIVALKVTRAGHLARPEDVLRFQAEATAAAKLDHPNIVPVYEVGESAGTRFFSMAFVEGESLAQTLVNGPLLPRRAAELIKLVAFAVEYAHRQSVIHRDLKPSNILLDSGGQPRVTDFGLAKCSDTDSQLTQAGEIMGTPSYMAPEQTEGNSELVGPFADVYALGATLYCLVTGRPPFQAATPIETIRQVVEREPISPGQLNPAVDRDLDTICLKCLQKRPDRRYASAAALAEDLQRFLDHRPIEARPVGPLEKFGQWCRRNKLVAGSIALTLGSFLIAFVLVSWSYWRAENALAAEHREREKAERKEQAERWERYRANIVAAASALQLHNVGAARRALQVAPEEHRDWEWRHFHKQLDLSRHVLRDRELPADSPFVSPSLSSVSSQRDRAFVLAPGDLLQVWNTSSRQLLSTLPLLSGCSTISPDGRLFATASNDDTIAVTNVDTGKVHALIAGHGKAIFSIQLSGDGTRLVTGGIDGTVHVWDLSTGKQLRAIRAHKANAGILHLTPDASLVLTCSAGHSHFRLWDLATGNEVASLGHPDGAITWGMFCPGSATFDRILTIERFPSNKMRLWSVTKKQELAVMSGHSNGITKAFFSPDLKTIVSCGMDQTIRLWNVSDGKLIATLRGHNGWVNSVRFSADGKHLVSASQDRTVRLWDVAQERQLAVLHGHSAEVFDAAYTSDAATIVSIDASSTTRLWDAQMAAQGGVLRGHANFAYSVAFHPDGKRLASAGWDGTVRLWNATTGNELSRLAYDKNTIVSSVAFHPQGELLATLGRDNAVRLWNMATSKQVQSLPLPAGDWRDRRLAFSKSGDLLAVGNTNGDVYLWKGKVAWGTDGAGVPAVLRRHRDAIKDVAFSPNDRWLAAASDDKTICIWDVATGSCAAVLAKHTYWVYALAWSPDSQLLASGSTDGTVRLWDTKTWQEAAILKHGTNVYCLAFTPNGSRLASACADNTIRVWDIARRQEVAELRGHEAYVHAVAFSPDGSRLASASGDFTVRLWDTLSSQERAQTR